MHTYLQRSDSGEEGTDGFFRNGLASDGPDSRCLFYHMDHVQM